MLALGDLNAEEPTSVGGGKVTPLPETLPHLHKGLQADVSPPVKVAALVGILRHAKLGIADKALERQIVSDLAALVKQKTPPPPQRIEGQQWLRRQAIEILGVLKQPGQNNEVVEALTPLVLDLTEPINLRLDALRALGNFKVPANALGEAVTIQLGEVTLEQLRNETNRRSLRYNLQSLMVGMKGADGTGVVASLSGPDKKYGDELARKIANYYSFVAQLHSGDPMTIQQTVSQEMLREADLLQIWLEEDVLPEFVEVAAQAPPAQGENP
jgi:hypothetical protein